jgi:hypothetical protein
MNVELNFTDDFKAKLSAEVLAEGKSWLERQQVKLNEQVDVLAEITSACTARYCLFGSSSNLEIDEVVASRWPEELLSQRASVVELVLKQFGMES